MPLQEPLQRRQILRSAATTVAAEAAPTGFPISVQPVRLIQIFPMTELSQRDFTLEPGDIERLAALCGPLDEHLRRIELRLGVEIANRGNVFRVIGPERGVRAAESLLRELYADDDTDTPMHERLNLALSARDAEVDVPVSSWASNLADDTRPQRQQEARFGMSVPLMIAIVGAIFLIVIIAAVLATR